ncbi:MAG TPA: hypothetical protein PLQ19_00090 [Aeromicrobium sp.]|nr:hypothetical protein [Aeromicrobium sp.]
MSRGEAIAAISTVAAEQWGMVTAGQARRLGVSRVDLGRLIADGSVAPVLEASRVYRLTGVAENYDLDPLRAAWLQLGGEAFWHERSKNPDVVVRHRSAAHVWGLGDLIPRRHEFYATTRLRPRREDIKIRVHARLDPGWEMHDGLPVTGIAATISDLFTAGEDISALRQMISDALELGLVTERSLREDADFPVGLLTDGLVA